VIEQPKELRFPVDCDTPAKRTEYCYRAQELLRGLHNGMRKWYRDGLTQNQWNKLPQRIKNRYPYTAQLSQADWDDFTEKVFMPISGKIGVNIVTQRALLFESTTWTIAVEDI